MPGFECKHCTKHFSRTNDLNYHIKNKVCQPTSHSNETTCPFSGCTKKFAPDKIESNRKHRNLPHFRCSCGSVFTRKSRGIHENGIDEKCGGITEVVLQLSGLASNLSTDLGSNPSGFSGQDPTAASGASPSVSPCTSSVSPGPASKRPMC